MKKLLMISSAIMGLSSLAMAQHTTKTDSLKLVHLQEVQVSATRASKKTPMSFTNISKQELSKKNLGQDIPYLLQLTPSLVATSDAGTGIGYTSMRIRGVDPTRINVMIDGVPLNDSESQGVFFVDIPDLSSSIQDIQIQRGVGTSSNGVAAFGASVNLQTQHLAQRAGATLGLSGGSFGTFRREVQLNSGRLQKHWAVETRLSKINSNGYIDRGSVDLNSYFIQGAYFDENTIVKLMAFGGTEVTGIAWNGISPDNIKKYGRTYNTAGVMGMKDGKPLYYKNTDNYDMRHYHLVINRMLNDRWGLNLTFHRTDGYGFTHEFRTKKKLLDFGLQPYVDPVTNEKVKKFNLVRRKYLDNTFNGLIASLNYKTSVLSVDMGVAGNVYSGDHYGQIRWSNYPKAVNPDAWYYYNKGKKKDFSAYIKSNRQVTDKLSLYADLQYRYISYSIKGDGDNYDAAKKGLFNLDVDQKYSFINPKAGLFYQINKNNSMYASFAVSNREPDRSSFTNLYNKDYPKSERLIDYELGYKFSSHRFSFSTNLYYMDYKNQLVATGKYNDVGGALLTNVPKSYRMGVEMSLAALITKGLRYDMSLSLSKNKIDNFDYYISVYDKDFNWLKYDDISLKNVDISYSPKVITTHRLSYTYKGFEADATFKFIGKQYLDNTQDDGRSIPHYSFTNIRLGYDIPTTLVRRLNLNLMVNNVFNQKYVNNGYVYDLGKTPDGTYNDLRVYPQAGINFLAGLTIGL